MLTAETLRKIIVYCPETGMFRWSIDRYCCVAGQIAGGKSQEGYWRIRIFRRLYYGHQLAWLYVHGRWPATDIDHANGNPADNRLANLREATRRQNLGNKRLAKNNTTGFKGVVRCKGRFRAVLAIAVPGRKSRGLSLGCFATAEEASAAYMVAAKDWYGEEFARAM